MRVLVVGDGFVPRPDLAFEPVDREVDLRQPGSGLVLLMAVERNPVHRFLARIFDEVAGLDEHPAGAASGVEDDAVVGLDDVDDGLNDGRWREELAVVVRALLGEFGEEILVDAPENVPRGLPQGFGVEGTHHAFEKLVVEALVVLGELTGERLEALLDRFHRLGQGRADAFVLGCFEDLVEARGLGQHQCPAPGKVGRDGLAVGHLPGLPVDVDGGHCLVAAVGRLAQEEQPHDGHEILVRGEAGVGAQVIGNLPELGLEFLEVCEMVGGHCLFGVPALVSPCFLTPLLRYQRSLQRRPGAHGMILQPPCARRSERAIRGSKWADRSAEERCEPAYSREFGMPTGFIIAFLTGDSA